MGSIVFHAGEIQFAGARETDNGGRTATFDLILTQAQQRMANPFSVATRRRGKRAGTRFTASLMPVTGPKPPEPWTDEFMLLGWSDGPKGSTVTFLLPDDTDTPHPFMRCRRGTAFMAGFVELADDEQPVDQERAQQAEDRPHGQLLSNQAALLLKAPKFCQWLRKWYLPKGVTDTPDDQILKLMLQIKSKSELDTDPAAASRFLEMRRAYNS